jgi:hypothetical protein
VKIPSECRMDLLEQRCNFQVSPLFEFSRCPATSLLRTRSLSFRLAQQHSC